MPHRAANLAAGYWIVAGYAGIFSASRNRSCSCSTCCGTRDEGRALLSRTFRIERFEPAPAGSYRSLYRLAVATLWA